MDKVSIQDLHIVLVEPSDTQRKIITTLLLKEKVKEIDAVSTLAEAKAAIKAHGADLIVSAMYFEDGTAIELLTFIKEHAEHAAIPFMLISSENRLSKLEELKQAGVAAILPKPFEPLHLSRALNASLDLINHDELDLDLFDVREVRVLLVDDSRLARNHIRRVLEGMGLEKIKEAENGAMALTLINGWPESSSTANNLKSRISLGDKNWLIKLSSLKLCIAKCTVSSQSLPATSGI